MSVAQPFRRRNRSFRTSARVQCELLESRQLLAWTPELVADVEPHGTFGDISQIVALGDIALFVADDGFHGAELWRSDGTNAGTYLLADLNPLGESLPQMLGQVGNHWLFTADDGEHGRELWRTDGTPEGTELTWESAPGVDSRLVHPALDDVVTTSTGMYFTLAGPQGSTEIWHTDGAADGATLVWTLEPTGGPPTGLTGIREWVVTADETLFFTRDGEAYFQPDVWALGFIDRELGLRDLRSFDIPNSGGLEPSPRELTAVGDRVYLAAADLTIGREIWTTTFDSEIESIDVLPGPGYSNPNRLAAAGSELYFFANNYGSDDWGGLWKLDSTSGVLSLVKELSTAELAHPTAGLDRNIVTASNHVFFTTLDGESIAGRRLWVTDGTDEGTSPLVQFVSDFSGPISPQLNELTPFGEKLFFSAENKEFGRELWISDGTVDGTRLVHDIHAGMGGALPLHLTPVGDRLFFTASDGLNGRRLWVADGDGFGAQVIELETNASFGSRPLELTVLGDEIYFTADTLTSGRELWRTDGTPQGTSMVIDLVPGEGSSIQPTNINPRASLTSFGQHVYFTAAAPVPGALWRTDGTPEGTQLLSDVFGVEMSGQNYQDAFREIGGTLYVTTNRLWSIAPGAAAPVDLGRYSTHFSNRSPLIDAWGQLAVFAQSFGSNRTAILTSDGTSEGTDILASLPFTSTEISDFAVSGDMAYIVHLARVPGSSWRQSLHVLNLITGHQTLLDSADVFMEERDQQDLIDVDGTLFFTRTIQREGEDYFELWATNGTTLGTRMVKSFQTGGFGENATQFTAMNGVLYFVMADDELGEELWRSDGTPEGTFVVKDIAPDHLHSFPTNLAVVNNCLFFSANDATHGFELWRSDGTANGTMLVAELREGGGPDGSSYPRNITYLNGQLFFAARDVRHGDELWSIRPSGGDTNFDGNVDLEDLNNVRNHFGGTGLGDADGDGDVDLDDLNAVRNHFGESSTQPPAEFRETSANKTTKREQDRKWAQSVDLLFTTDRFAFSELDSSVTNRKTRKPTRG
jgi:ELWxxDGT repeat protein